MGGIGTYHRASAWIGFTQKWYIVSSMTGEQTTLILGLAVFGMMVLLLSRAKPKKAVSAEHTKATHHKPPNKRRR